MAASKGKADTKRTVGMFFDGQDFFPHLENMPTPFFMLDPSWKFTYLNKASEGFLKRLHKTRKSIVGKNIWEEFPVTKDLPGYKEFHKAVSKKTHIALEVFFPPLNTWFALNAYPSQDGLAVYVQDITKRVEKERESRILAHALTTTKDSFSLSDLKKNILFVNQSFLNCFGYNEREIIGKPITGIFSQIHSSSFIDKIYSSKNKRGWNGEVVLRHKKGNDIAVEIWTSLVNDDDGKPVGYTTVLRDITERKRIDTLLENSERHFRTLIENSTDAIALFDLNGHIRYVTPSVTRVTGYSTEEMLHKSFFQYIHADDLEIAKGHFSNLLKYPKKHAQFEFRYKHKNGTWRWVETTGSNLLDDPYTHAIVSNFRDITERKASEEKAYLQSTALEAVSNAIVITDRNGIIQWVNNAWVNLTGYSVKEASGKNPRILKSGKQDQTYYAELWNTILARKVWKGEIINKRKDGSEYIEEETITPLVGQNGEIKYFIAVKHDITNRKKTEEAFRDQQEFLRKVIDLNPGLIFAKDRKGRFTLVNQAVAEVYGTNVEGLLGKTDGDFNPNPDEVIFFLKMDNEVMNSGQMRFIQEERITDANGKVRWLQTVKIPILQNDGTANQVLGVSTDITERRRTEQLQTAAYAIADAANTVQTLDELYRSVHKIIASIMPASNFYIALYHDKEKTLTFPYFVDEVDVIPPKGPIGRGLTAYVLRKGKSLLCDDKRTEELARLGEADLVGAPSPIWLGVPLIVEKKTIGVMVVQHYSDPKAYTEREVHMLEFVSSEVARAIDRKQAEKSIEQSLSLQSATLESTADGILVVDSEGKIVSYNQRFAQMWKIPQDVLAEQNDSKALDYVINQLRDPGGFVSKVRELYDHPDEESHDLLDFSDGRTFERYSLPQRIGKTIVGRVWSFRDITERKQFERLQFALYRIAEMAHSAADLNELYSAIHSILGELMYARNCYIALYDTSNNVISFPYSVDEKDVVRHQRKFEHGLTEYVLRTGQSLLATPELLDDLAHRGEISRHGAPSQDWMGVPLKKGDATFGCLVLQSYETHIRYGEKEKEILTFVSQQIATAIETRRSQDSLRESEAKFRGLAETAAAAIFIYQDTKFRYVNPPMEAATGYSRKELMQMDFWNIIHPSYRELVKERELARLRGEKVPSRYEFIIVSKEGDERWVEFASATIEYEGKPASLGTAYDITELIKAQDLLRASEAKFRTLFEQAEVAVYMSTPEGKLLDINPAGVELFGYTSKEELLKVDIPKELYVNPNDREILTRALSEAGSIANYELKVKRKNNEQRTVFITSKAVRDPSSNSIIYQGFMRDMTEQKKLEEELRQMQKLESIGTLAGGVAHDFNNILNIILGYTSILEGNKFDEEKLSQSIGAIKKATVRGANLVQQILTFARKTDVTLESVNVNAIIQELEKLLVETFPKNITFTLNLDPEAPSLLGDHTQIHQTLLNLCVNARDALFKGGSLTISTYVIPSKKVRERFHEAIDENYLCVSVKDTGKGMDEITRSRIFEPFFTTKEHGRGTGLGLAVVYGIIKGHRGFIDVESTPEQGTQFYLYLPIPPQPIAALQSIIGEEQKSKGGNETILVVEDEEMLLELMKGMLEEAGYTVLTASDGIEAVENYRRHKDEIALVLSDMGLPKLGGFEAFLEMRKINPKLIAILASGYLDPSLKAELLKAGAHDFIQKPYDLVGILRKIREAIDTNNKK